MSGHQSQLPVFIFPVFLLVFAAGWCLVCIKISKHGWSTWARHHRHDQPLPGKLYRGRSGRFSFQGSYARILNVRLCREGIQLSVMRLWRAGHPPLLMPWSAVTSFEEKQYLFMKLVRVTISDAGKTMVIRLPSSARQELEARRVEGTLYQLRLPHEC